MDAVSTNQIADILCFSNKYMYRELCVIVSIDCQQKVLKAFPGSGYLRSEDGII